MEQTGKVRTNTFEHKHCTASGGHDVTESHWAQTCVPNVIRVALFVSADVDKMWFLTTGPLIRIPVIFAEVSKRQDCWRIPVSRINRDRGRKLLLPHLFALLRWL